MPKPKKLNEVLKKLGKIDADIEHYTNKGKGGHSMLCRDAKGSRKKVSYPLPSGKEVKGPYLKAIGRAFSLAEKWWED